MDGLRLELKKEVEERWENYAKSLSNAFLKRRDANVQEILDGNLKALEQCQPSGKSLPLAEAQQKIVDAIQSQLEKTGGIPPILRLLMKSAANRRAASPQEPWRILELASGAGWLQLHLWKWLQKKGLPAQLGASDINPGLVKELATRLESWGVEATSQVADARWMPDMEDGAWDIAFLCYTLHHLPPGDAALCLYEMDRVSAGGLVVVDLLRGWMSWVGANISIRVFARDSGAFGVHDTQASVRRGYTVHELGLLLEWIGLRKKYNVGKLPTLHPQRMLAGAIWPK